MSSIAIRATSQAQCYEALAERSSVLPTQRELFEYQIHFWATHGLADEKECRRLVRHIPEEGLFLFVPRRPEPLDYERMMNCVVLEGCVGRSSYRDSHQRDQVLVPKGPYIATAVDDGRLLLNRSFSRALQVITNLNGSPYTAFEGIVHVAVFPWALLHHNISCLGSRKPDSVPSIYVAQGAPEFGNCYGDNHDCSWGAPACSQRKGLR